jgi:hypothetical protein
LSYELEPGAKTEGVLLYPKLDPDDELSIRFEGSDSEFNEVSWAFSW